MLGGGSGISVYNVKKKESVDHLAIQYIKMLGHDYERRDNEVVKCFHPLLCNKYEIERSRRLRSYSEQEINTNSGVMQQSNRKMHQILLFSTKREKIIPIECGIIG